MNNYKDLKVWRKAIDLTALVYSMTEKFPNREQFGLISQMNRASVSISSNIVEGAGRNSKGEFAQFLGIAIGSLYELETQVVIAERIKYIDKPDFGELTGKISELQKMVYGLKNTLK